MADIQSLYYLVLTVSTITSALITGYAWKKRNKTGSPVLTLLFLGITVWCAANLAVPVTEGLSRKLVVDATQIGVTFVPVLWLMFILEYTGRKDLLTPRNTALLLVLPLTMFLAAVTNPIHGLYFTELNYGFESPERSVLGPLLYLIIAYDWTAVLVATALLIETWITADHYRNQVLLLILASLAPFVGSIIYQLTEFPTSITPIGFAVTGVGVGWAILREDFTDITPVARDTVVDTIKSGVIVTDMNDRVIDMNPVAKEEFGVEGDAEGTDLTELLMSEYPDLKQQYRELAPFTSDQELRVEYEQEGGTNYFDVTISQLHDNHDNQVGQVFVVHNVTDEVRRSEKLRERERQLEHQKNKLKKQNERLDRFASIVSHDLRNPLNVAQGYTEMIEDEVDMQEVDEVHDSIDRMKDIIDDALTLAREGNNLNEFHELNLSEAARDAWENVETGETELQVETDLSVYGDRNRLLTLFENLYRNAVEHGTENTALTVRVGDHEPGFYVEDDGEGIPPEIRDDVFEQGYSTNDEGTGLGLSIVRSIANAHGWDLELTEGSEGGARIEFDTGEPRTEQARPLHKETTYKKN